MSKQKLILDSAKRFLNFVDSSPSPFHAVKTSKDFLEKNGFIRIRENEPWKNQLKRGGKYYFTRNASTCIAFAIGEKFTSGSSGFSIIGAHTDSPCLKLKPISRFEKNGYLQVGVQLYGGGQWHSWFDKDLSVAGRVILKDAKTNNLQQKLVRIERSILRIPTVAIHLNRSLNTEGFKFDMEKHLAPILSTKNGPKLNKKPPAPKVIQHDNKLIGGSGDFYVKEIDESPAKWGYNCTRLSSANYQSFEEMNEKAKTVLADDSNPLVAYSINPDKSWITFKTESKFESKKGWISYELDQSSDDVSSSSSQASSSSDTSSSSSSSSCSSSTSLSKQYHHSELLECLSKKLSCDPDEITDLELCLYDTQPAAIGGIHDEFIFSARQDNLVSSFCALEGLVDSLDSLSEEQNIRLLCLYDNEEVGSRSYMGADSSLLDMLIPRIVRCFNDGGDCDAIEQTFRNSFCVSADMAHAVHPNWSEKHEARHSPQINQGPVIKHNANQRYATSAATASILRDIAKTHEIPVQDFVIKQNMGCGSTIGPMTSAKSIRTVDIGNPQLSMHSIRETCGCQDVFYAIGLFKNFYQDFTKVDTNLIID